MAVQVEGNVKTFPAGEVLAAFRRVKVDSSGNVVYADADEAFDGVTQDAAAAIGDHVAVKLRTGAGTFKVTANAAVTVAASLYGAADGKVATTGTGVQFRAFEAAAADGDIIEAGLA